MKRPASRATTKAKAKSSSAAASVSKKKKGPDGPDDGDASKVKKAYKYMYHQENKYGIKLGGREFLTVGALELNFQL
jgi:hypothetical protein